MVQAEYCLTPFKRKQDVNCHIPCQISNCSVSFNVGIACANYKCRPKVTTTTSAPKTTISDQEETTSKSTTSTNKALDDPKRDYLKNENCDYYDCHVETIQAEICYIPTKKPSDIYCVIPCHLSNCSLEMVTGIACPQYFCIPRIQPTPPQPGPTPPQPNPSPAVYASIGLASILGLVILLGTVFGVWRWRRTRNFRAFIDEPSSGFENPNVIEEPVAGPSNGAEMSQEARRRVRFAITESSDESRASSPPSLHELDPLAIHHEVQYNRERLRHLRDENEMERSRLRNEILGGFGFEDVDLFVPESQLSIPV